MQCQPAKGQGKRQRPNRLLIADSLYRSNTSPVASVVGCLRAFLLSTGGRTRLELQHKMVCTCRFARSFTSIWTHSMRPWSSATILSFVASPLWSRGVVIAPSYALHRMKRESSECVLLCLRF